MQAPAARVVAGLLALLLLLTPISAQQAGEDSVSEAIRCPLCHAAFNYLVRRVVSLRRQCRHDPSAPHCEKGDIAEAQVIDMLSSFCSGKVLEVFPAVTEAINEAGDEDEVEGDAEPDFAGDGEDDTESDDLPRRLPDAEGPMQPIEKRFHALVSKVCEAHVLRKHAPTREALIHSLMDDARSPDARNLEPRAGDTRVSRRRLLWENAKQRRRDYDVVFAFQKAMCAKACGPQFEMPPAAPRFKGWNVFGLPIDFKSFDEL